MKVGCSQKCLGKLPQRHGEQPDNGEYDLGDYSISILTISNAYWAPY